LQLDETAHLAEKGAVGKQLKELVEPERSNDDAHAAHAVGQTCADEQVAPERARPQPQPVAVGRFDIHPPQHQLPDRHRKTAQVVGQHPLERLGWFAAQREQADVLEESKRIDTQALARHWITEPEERQQKAGELVGASHFEPVGVPVSQPGPVVQRNQAVVEEIEEVHERVRIHVLEADQLGEVDR